MMVAKNTAVATVDVHSHLVAYDRVNNVDEFVRTLGKSIAMSQMFGCDSVEQGEVIALECMTRKLPPLSMAEKYHVIKGKLSMKSEAMLAEWRRRGGSHRAVVRTPDNVEIELVDRDGTKTTSCLSWEEAQREPFPYEGKESEVIAKLESGERPKLKAKYATPRSRMQMLWARLVSDTIRFLAPEICSGTYTPEEVSDFTGQDGDAGCDVIEAEVIEAVEQVEPITEEPQADSESPGMVIDTVAEPDGDPSEAPIDGPCSEEMIRQIKQAIEATAQVLPNIVELIKQRLTACGLQKLADLSTADARVLLDAIERKSVEAFFEKDLAGHSELKRDAVPF